MVFIVACEISTIRTLALNCPKITVGIYFVRPCRVGSVGSVSASHTVGCEFASRPGHTKDHHKDGTNRLPSWHVMS